MAEKYDIDGARAAGISDAEIADTLAPKMNYDIAAARKAGVPDNEIADALAGKFNLMNPNLERQGAKAQGLEVGGDPLKTIGGAGLAGALIGAGGAELVGGAAKLTGMLPQTRALQPFLETTAAGLRNAGRVAPAISGGIAGITGETAGQAADAMGAPWPVAEAARFAGGAIGPESGVLASWAVRNKLGIPAIVNKLKEMTGKEVALTEAQKKFLEAEIAKLSGGATDADLESIGSLMSAEGQRMMTGADVRLARALRGQSSDGTMAGTPPVDLSTIGQSIRDKVIPQFQAADQAQKKAYEATQKFRDQIVTAKESNGSFVNSLREYQDLVEFLRAQLVDGRHSPDVARGYKKILDSISVEQPTGEPLTAMLTPRPPKSPSFQQIDDARRQLGDAFRGKPAEGYEALDANRAKDVYMRLRDLQVKYAGGPSGPQDKLLSDYAADIPGLEKFTSKIGKKVTALDQYREGVYATDPKDIPTAFFKSRQSFKDLVALTGDEKVANAAALEYANRQLVGKDAAATRKWMADQEWISSAPSVRVLVENYANRLETSAKSVASAEEFVKQVKGNTRLLLAQKMPAQKAVDLVEASLQGKTELMDVIGPVIAKSPQARQEMLRAVSRVVADNSLTQTSARNTMTLFNRNLRPMLEKANIADKASLDFIAERLDNISKMKVPEPQKLGLARRLLLQGVAGWEASRESRALMVPD